MNLGEGRYSEQGEEKYSESRRGKIFWTRRGKAKIQRFPKHSAGKSEAISFISWILRKYEVTGSALSVFVYSV